MDRSGDPSKRRKKTKQKPKSGNPEVGGPTPAVKEQKGKETDSNLLSGQTAVKATLSHDITSGSEGAVQDMQQTQETDTMKSLEAAGGFGETGVAILKGSEKGRKSSGPVQSRLAWKTMARPVSPTDALKVIVSTLILSNVPRFVN